MATDLLQEPITRKPLHAHLSRAVPPADERRPHIRESEAAPELATRQQTETQAVFPATHERAGTESGNLLAAGQRVELRGKPTAYKDAGT